MEAMRTASKNTRGPMKICLGEGIGLTARMLYPAGRRMRASGPSEYVLLRAGRAQPLLNTLANSPNAAGQPGCGARRRTPWW